MPVTHYVIKNKIVCGIKSNNPLITNDQKFVTCKNCLKKIPKEEHLFDISLVYTPKWKYCLKIDDDTLIKIGDTVDEYITIIAIINKKNIVTSTIVLENTDRILKILTNEQLTMVKNLFTKAKEKFNRFTIDDIKTLL